VKEKNTEVGRKITIQAVKTAAAESTRSASADPDRDLFLIDRKDRSRLQVKSTLEKNPFNSLGKRKTQRARTVTEIHWTDKTCG
jgi:hypothetical protein